MPRRRALLAVGFGLLASCREPPLRDTCEWSPSDHVQPESAAPSPSPRRAAPRTERSTDPLAAATALWNVTCASCHGRSGHGDGPAAPGPIVSFASTEWQRANDDAAITAVITQGRGLMPPFGETIAPTGIEALVNLIRRFGGSPPDGAPPPAGRAEAAPTELSAPSAGSTGDPAPSP